MRSEEPNTSPIGWSCDFVEKFFIHIWVGLAPPFSKGGNGYKTRIHRYTTNTWIIA